MRVDDAEIGRLAARLELADHEFRALYTRRLRGGEISLRERRDKACVFWAPASGCGVYSDRPRQCRTWPFWGAVVASRERWEEEAQGCPGMNRGPLVDASAIDASAEADGTSGTRPDAR